jgi:hypothetical protein
MAKVLDEIQALGDLDPQVQRELIQDLRNTRPALWPAMTQQFRAALAYRRQLEAREANEAGPIHPKDLARPSDTVMTHGETPTQPGTYPVQPRPSPALPQHAPAQHSSALRDAAPAQTRLETPVAQTAFNHALDAPSEWHVSLAETIEALERQTQGAARSGHELQQHALLRMLYLFAGQQEKSLRPIEGISPTLQDFWSKQLLALATYLNDESGSDEGRRIEEAKRLLTEAADKLAELSCLTVGSLAFCSEVSSFGVYKALQGQDFSPGQEVLLYAEVGNFKSQETDKGYHTVLRSSYEILDEQGHRIDEYEFGTTEDYCQNRRRDFFMRYFVKLPKPMKDGTYTLQLTIEDTQARKIGQGVTPFRVKSLP